MSYTNKNTQTVVNSQSIHVPNIWFYLLNTYIIFKFQPNTFFLIIFFGKNNHVITTYI